MAKKTWLQNHPLSKQNLEKVVPIKFFGDGIAVLGISKSWGRSAEAITLQPVLTESHARLSSVLLALVFKGKRTEHTMDTLYELLVWSLRALYEGVHPEKDWKGRDFPKGSFMHANKGKPLANGYSACIVVGSLVQEKKEGDNPP
eukprot:6459463-Amphidinium_carterae.1